MRYETLQDLISGSNSSRKYFLSQSVPMQMQLHKYNEHIHSAAELHTFVEAINKYNHAVEISEMLL